MYCRAVLSLNVAIVTLSLKIQDVVGNSISNAAYEVILSKVDSRLNIAAKLVETARREFREDLKQICRNTTCGDNSICCSKGSYPDEKPMDCSDIYSNGFRTSGVYHIWPKSRVSNGPLSVYCNMEDGGGWTVIQRRGDFGNVPNYFFQKWNSYKTGFGHLLREFWIGNDNLFFLTSQKPYKLKVDLTDWRGNSKYANYREFWIDEEIFNYTLHVHGYNGTAGDSLSSQNGADFTTRDRDSRDSSRNFASRYFGAWWFTGDTNSEAHLNGQYLRKFITEFGKGVIWKTFRGYQYSLKDVEMKIKPVGFEASVNKPAN